VSCPHPSGLKQSDVVYPDIIQARDSWATNDDKIVTTNRSAGTLFVTISQFRTIDHIGQL